MHFGDIFLSIHDLEFQRQKKADMDARKKFIADELKRYKETDNSRETGFE